MLKREKEERQKRRGDNIFFRIFLEEVDGVCEIWTYITFPLGKQSDRRTEETRIRLHRNVYLVVLCFAVAEPKVESEDEAMENKNKSKHGIQIWFSHTPKDTGRHDRDSHFSPLSCASQVWEWQRVECIFREKVRKTFYLFTEFIL